MTQNLENYLEEISRYLAVKDDAKEILSEIQSHILEKTEAEFGTITEDGIAKTISKYGKPQRIAAEYLEEIEIISPTFKRHLFLYTGILFACHFGLSLVALLFHFSMVGFPFFYIPKMNTWQFFCYVPTALLYDFGLVTTFLYLVTQRRKDVHLPWPGFLAKAKLENEMRKPKIVFMVFSILIFLIFLYPFIRFGTIFFASMNNPGNPMPLFDHDASRYYSLLFLAMIACEVIGYAARFINRSRWIDLIKNLVILIFLQFVWNSPVKVDFAKIPGIDLKKATITFALIFTAIIAFRFLKSLIQIGTQQFLLKKRS